MKTIFEMMLIALYYIKYKLTLDSINFSDGKAMLCFILI